MTKPIAATRAHFKFAWTGTRWASDDDEARGISAAEDYCARCRIDPVAAWDDYRAELERDDLGPAANLWTDIERAAGKAMTEGWHEDPDNYCLELHQ